MTAIPVDVVARSETTLPLIEQFGPTIQGEGPAAGRAAAFVRLAGCDLSCSWCDTPESWQAGVRQRTQHRSVAAIVTDLPSPPLPVVITGGEPLLHQSRPAWHELLHALAARPLWFETNGTIVPTSVTLRRADLLVVSPKLSNAGPHRGRQSPAVAEPWRRLARLDDRVHGKYVVGDPLDVREALEHARQLDLPTNRTWLMPQATTAAEHARLWPMVAEEAARAGVGASPRLHVLAWGTEKGR